MRRKPTNPEVLLAIEALYSSGNGIKRTIAEDLEKGSATRVCVNVGELARLAEGHKGVVVPGKVLGQGELKGPVTVAASSFSQSAREKIEKAGGRCLSLLEFAKMEGPSSDWILVKRSGKRRV